MTPLFLLIPDVVFSIYSLIAVGCSVDVCGWRLKLPVVETIEEHLSQLVHSPPFRLGQIVELVANKISDSLKKKTQL